MANETVHDPDAVLDYSLDWSQLLGDGETLASAVWTLPAGLTEAPQGQSHDDTTATVWVSGGTVNENYRIVCHVVTSEGREDDDSILLRCREK